MILEKIKGMILPGRHIPQIKEVTEDGYWKERSRPTKSLLKTAELFNSMGGKIIVEIGSGMHGPLSGNSILVWAKRTRAKKIFAVDHDTKRIEEVRSVTKRFGAVAPVLEDGLVFIDRFDEMIDLLYLDFWPPEPEGDLWGTGRAHVYLEIYEKARKKMSVDSLILIDDTDHIPPWKDTLIVPKARKDGFQVLWIGRQTLLKRTSTG